MSETILIRGARQLLTLHGPPGPRRGAGLRNLGIIEDGSVLVVDGKIASVGPTRRVENLAGAHSAREIDATGRVVMPAFVDAYTELMRDGGAGSKNVRRLDATAHRVLAGCVRHGTATVDVRSGLGRDETADLRMLRAAASLSGEAATVVPVYAAPDSKSLMHEQNSTEQFEWFEQTLFPRIQARGLTRFAAVRCGPDGFDLEQASRYMEICSRHGLVVKLELADRHVREFIGLAVRNRAAVVEGLSDIDEFGMAALAASSVIATLVPAFELTASVRPSTAVRLIEAGVPVALGSGFRHHETSTFSMQMTISLACAHLGMRIEEAIAAATVNSAYAVGLGDTTGSLQFGNDADMIILNVPDYREIAEYFGVNLVAATIKKGRYVYREPAVPINIGS